MIFINYIDFEQQSLFLVQPVCNQSMNICGSNGVCRDSELEKGGYFCECYNNTEFNGTKCVGQSTGNIKIFIEYALILVDIDPCALQSDGRLPCSGVLQRCTPTNFAHQCSCYDSSTDLQNCASMQSHFFFTMFIYE